MSVEQYPGNKPYQRSHYKRLTQGIDDNQQQQKRPRNNSKRHRQTHTRGQQMDSCEREVEQHRDYQGEHDEAQRQSRDQPDKLVYYVELCRTIFLVFLIF